MNISEKILPIVGIVFALIFCGVMVGMSTGLINTGNDSNKQLQSMMQTSDTSNLDAFSNTTIYGSNVVNAVKNPGALSNNQLRLYVLTKADNGGHTYYTKNTDNSNPGPYKVTDVADNKYINPSAQFVSNLLYNNNDVITGIVFIQEGVDASSFTGTEGYKVK